MFEKQYFKLANSRLHSAGDLFIIAEIGLAHEGSLGAAIAMVDAAARCGVNAVKFQTHLADQEGTVREMFRVPVFPQDRTRQAYWRRTAFDLQQWKHLAEYTRSKGLVFLSSPFSIRAVEWLEQCEVPAWKIASGELSNYPMIEVMCETGKPILISSGMSSWSELDSTIRFIEGRQASYGVFQCTTSYPCPPEKWGLNVIAEMLGRFDCPTGLSDHSGSTVPGLAAVAIGATLLEVHFTFSKNQFGPDSKASLTEAELAELVRAANQLHTARDNPIDKDKIAGEFLELRSLFTKSIVAASKLPAGHVLRQQDLAFKKPGDGISAKEFQSLVGKTLSRDVESDHLFSLKDFAE